MSRPRKSRFRSSMSSETAALSSSLDYHSEIPHDLFDQPLEIVEADTVKFSPPLPSSFSPGKPPSSLLEDGLVSSPHAPGASSVSSNHSHMPSPQPTDMALLRNIPQSPKLSSPNSSTLALKMMYPQSHMIMDSPSVPGSPSWMRPTPISSGRIRHNDYYLEDGVIFLAENTLFKVPRYMLNQESEAFLHLYSDQFEQGGKGSTDGNPIILDGLEAADFQRLLTVLYPRSIPSATNATERWTDVEWKSVLHLADMWQMPQLWSLAMGKISSCASSLTKIILGKQYDISQWIRAGFLDLCLRDGPLTEDEGSRLDWKDILKISRAREMIIFKVLSINRQREWESTKYGDCPVYKSSYDPSRYTQNFMVHHILDEVFELEDLASDINSRTSSPALLQVYASS